MLPAFQVLDSFILILQVVANDRINVGEVESSVLLGDFSGVDPSLNANMTESSETRVPLTRRTPA
jgi:hypothetical protein